MALNSDLHEIKDLKDQLANTLVEKGVEADSSEGLKTLVPKVEQIQGGITELNADLVWRITFPQKNSGKEILDRTEYASIEHCIVYIFDGDYYGQVPTNGIRYVTAQGDVQPGSDVHIECEEGKDTSWFIEVYNNTSATPINYNTETLVGECFKGVVATMQTRVAKQYQAIWAVGNSSVVRIANSTFLSCIYIEDGSTISGNYSIQNYCSGIVKLNHTSDLTWGKYDSLFAGKIILDVSRDKSIKNNTPGPTGAYEIEVIGATENIGTLRMSITGYQKKLAFRDIFSSFAGWVGASYSFSGYCIEVANGTDVDLKNGSWGINSRYSTSLNGQMLYIKGARTGLLEKVADHTGEDAARTISIGWVSTLAESEYEAVQDALLELQFDFSEKGWLLA